MLNLSDVEVKATKTAILHHATPLATPGLEAIRLQYVGFLARRPVANLFLWVREPDEQVREGFANLSRTST
jgi:hypothetical protein